jgi:hypothetical protein
VISPFCTAALTKLLISVLYCSCWAAPVYINSLYASVVNN